MSSEPNVVPLLGAITGRAKDVEEAIWRAAIGRQMLRFLIRLHQRSFSTAGYQRDAGAPLPGGSYEFDNAEWGHALGMTRQAMWRLRVQAEHLRIVRYIPNPTDPTRGTLVWNLALDEWIPLSDEYRKLRQRRPGAGAKPKPRTDDGAACPSGAESEWLRTPATAESNGLRTVASTESEWLRTVATGNSNGLRSPATGQFKLVTPASLESALAAVSARTLRKGTKELGTEEEENTASAVGADLAVAPVEPDADAVLAAVDAALSEPSPAAAVPAPAPETPPPEEPVWPPPRLPEDHGEIDIYLRVLKAAKPSERVAVLTRLANDKLGAPLSYGRIGRLARDAGGAGVLAKHILSLSGTHIDGDDPLDYLQKVIRNAKKRAEQGQGPGGSGNRPRAAPEPPLPRDAKAYAPQWDDEGSSAPPPPRRRPQPPPQPPPPPQPRHP